MNKTFISRRSVKRSLTLFHRKLAPSRSHQPIFFKKEDKPCVQLQVITKSIEMTIKRIGGMSVDPYCADTDDDDYFHPIVIIILLLLILILLKKFDTSDDD